MLLVAGCTDSSESEGGAEALVKQSQAETELASAPAVFDDSPIDVNFTFANASFNEADDAKMSKLTFNLNGNRGKQSLGSTKIEMSDPKVEATRMDLDICAVDVRPILTDEHSAGNDVGVYGGYELTVADAGGNMLGMFQVNNKGSMSAKDCGSGCGDCTSFDTKLVRSEDGGKVNVYHIYPKNMAEGERYRPVVELAFAAGEPAGYNVETPGGTNYMYAFPNGTLTLKPSELISLGRDKLAAERHSGDGMGGEMSGTSCSTASGGGGG